VYCAGCEDSNIGRLQFAGTGTAHLPSEMASKSSGLLEASQNSKQDVTFSKVGVEAVKVEVFAVVVFCTWVLWVPFQIIE
jgi:hypothetical protein